MSPRSKYWGNACPLSNMDRVFGRPFVKRFALCYQAIVCPVCPGCLSVTLVYCCQTVGRIKMKLGMEVGLCPDHIVLDGSLLPPKNGVQHPQFYPVYCGQTAVWIKMPLGTGVRLGPAQATLCCMWTQLPLKRGTAPPHFSAHVYCG